MRMPFAGRFAFIVALHEALLAFAVYTHPARMSVSAEECMMRLPALSVESFALYLPMLPSCVRNRCSLMLLHCCVASVRQHRTNSISSTLPHRRHHQPRPRWPRRPRPSSRCRQSCATESTSTPSPAMAPRASTRRLWVASAQSRACCLSASRPGRKRVGCFGVCEILYPFVRW